MAPLQRARAVDRIVARQRDRFLRRVGERQGQFALRQPLAQQAQLDLHDVRDLLHA